MESLPSKPGKNSPQVIAIAAFPWLIDCASPGRAFEARNAQELTDTFSEIATQLAELRLTN